LLFLTDLTVKIIGVNHVQLSKPFKYESDMLGCIITIPAGFVSDFESVPLMRGCSRRAGVIHDYLCRIDSRPVTTKNVAADVYLEAMAHRDSLLHDGWYARHRRTLWRRIKSCTVKIAIGYFHKLFVFDSYKKIIEM
jgi:hypothetical protein